MQLTQVPMMQALANKVTKAMKEAIEERRKDGFTVVFKHMSLKTMHSRRTKKVRVAASVYPVIENGVLMGHRTDLLRKNKVWC